MKHRIRNPRGESGRRKARRIRGTGIMTNKSRAAQGYATKKTPGNRITMPKQMIGLTGCKDRRRNKRIKNRGVQPKAQMAYIVL